MKTIKLTENKLNQIISESVTEILKEMKENKQLKESKQENKQVRLTEAELTKIVAESTVRILKESDMDESWFSSVGKGIKNMVNNGGGLNGFRNTYNDSRAADMNQKAQAQADANSAKEQQIRTKYEQMKQQLQQQLNGLDIQMQQELAQIGAGQKDYAGKAANYTKNAENARKAHYNSWNPQDQQQMS